MTIRSLHMVRRAGTGLVAPPFARHCTLLLAVGLFAVCLAACDTSAEDALSGEQASEMSVIEVPDVVGEDGAFAVSDLEGSGFTAALVDQAGDYRDDGSGCTVEDQDPVGGDEGVEGDEVTVALDCRSVDWENQEGDVWDEFTVGYESGFEEGCEALFDLSPDGSLYEGDTEYTSFDCPTPDVFDAGYPADVPDDPEAEGHDLGFEDGCDALFDDVALSYELYYGEDAYTADDCKAQGGVAAPSELTPSDGGGTGDASRDCPPGAAGQFVVSVRPISGQVNCPGATALWKAYLSAAPEQGQGSSGYTEIDGWGCLTAKPPEGPRLGSCSKGGDEFAVYEATE
jgi:hypothetical protein